MDKFGLLVVGSRTCNNYNQFCEVMNACIRPISTNNITIISGGAKGADTLARRFAIDRGYEFREFLADWNKFGKSAGYKRNEQMHEFLKANFSNRGCIAFWDGTSRGTSHNFDLTTKYNTQLIVFDFVKCDFLYDIYTESHHYVLSQNKASVPVDLPF